MEVGDVRHLEVITDLLTRDAARVRPGQPVVFGRWGGEAPIRGRVRTIEPSPFTKVSALGVEEQRRDRECLSEGDVVIVYPSERIADGGRVRPRG